MSPMPRWKPTEKVRVRLHTGTRVHAVVGTKSGYGTIAAVLPAGYIVEFDEAKYPETIAVVTGAYFVNDASILKVLASDTSASGTS